MAHLSSPRPSRSDFSGPLRNFLSVRSEVGCGGLKSGCLRWQQLKI